MYVKSNEQNVLIENPVSILCEIRTSARLNSSDCNIKSRSRSRTFKYQVASFEGIANGWFVYFHDQWCIIGSFSNILRSFSCFCFLRNSYPSVDLLLWTDDHDQWMRERCSSVYRATSATSIVTTYCQENIPKNFPENF